MRGVVIVEGPSDRVVLSEALNVDRDLFFPVSGRRNVLLAADALETDYIAGVVCVADADFDDEPAARDRQWYLVFSDNADLDAMLFLSPAFERLLEHWAAPEKLEDLGGPQGIRAAVADAVRVLSTLRRQNELLSLGLDFNAMDLRRAINRRTLASDPVALVDHLAAVSGVAAAAIHGIVGEPEPTCPFSGFLLVRGRDCFVVVEIALRHVIGSLPRLPPEVRAVERTLRAALRPGDLDRTPFAHRVRTARARAIA